LETNDSKQQILLSQKLFNRALDQAEAAFRLGNFNAAIAWAQITAHFATVRHPGFYVSPTLENLLLRIAQKIRQPPQTTPAVLMLKQKQDLGKMHFLHVVSEIYSGGGHSAFIERWIKNTNLNSIHSLVSTSKNNQLPNTLFAAIEESGGWHYSLPDLTQNLVERALFLRQIANSWADVIVLFIHPFDPLPTVAFGIAEGPPVIFCNHADHQFWLGASIIDVPIDYHVSGSLISSKRRGIKESKILPIPLLKNNNGLHDKANTRKKLGLKDEEIMMLTVAREEKFLPYNGVNFFEVMVKFLKQNPNAKLFAVGPQHQGKWVEASTLVDGRIRALGTLDRPVLDELFEAADVYVTSFPCGSGTALLEAGLRGLPLAGLQNKEMPNLTGQDDVAFEKLPVHAASINELYASLEGLIKNRSSGKEWAVTVKESIENTHCSPGWNSYLEAILQSLPSQHHIRAIADPSGELDYSDFYLTYLCSKMLSDELVEHSFARLIRVYSKNLPRKDCFRLQAKSLSEALLKVRGKQKVKEYLYNFREFVESI
jgi:hypothetical protein